MCKAKFMLAFGIALVTNSDFFFTPCLTDTRAFPVILLKVEVSAKSSFRFLVEVSQLVLIGACLFNRTQRTDL